MIFISATRLKIRSIFYIPAFLTQNEAVIKQIIKSDGFLSGQLLVDKGLTFWTITIWQSEAEMKAFRNNLAHRRAMPKLPGWCNEASYVHWTHESYTFPNLETLYDKMANEGKFTTVKNPSKAHINRHIPPIRWKKIIRSLNPVSASATQS